MSMPITFCSVVKATKDEEAYQLLLKKVEYNRMQAAWTQLPCACDPKCRCTEEELENLNARIEQDLIDLRNSREPIKVPPVDIGAAVEFMVKHANDANWDSVSRAFKILKEGCENDDSPTYGD